MSTIIRSLIIGLLLTVNLIQPIYRGDFDDHSYNNQIQFAEKELENIKIQVQNKVGYHLERVWTSEDYANYIKILYQQQRRFFKALLKCIKDTKDNRFSYAFESEIYKQWKYTFKRNYKNSLATDNWNWTHHRFSFERWE
jgi:hypothetical protein